MGYSLASDICSREDTGNGLLSVPSRQGSNGRKAVLWRRCSPLQEEVKILGVEVDQGLRFDSHVKAIDKKASQKISALRRVAGLFDRKVLLLYKAQVRPHLEYVALSWMSCAATHRKRLASIQRRALRLVDTVPTPHQVPVSSRHTGTPKRRGCNRGVP